MRYIIRRLVGTVRFVLRLLGLGALGSVALAGLVALRHILMTPQPLDSPLPGEAHLYRWKHGHIYYKVAGEQHAPPMVLIHTPELAGSAYEMLGIMASLAASYRVYALDLLGFGLSDRPDLPYTADLYTELLHDFIIDSLGAFHQSRHVALELLSFYRAKELQLFNFGLPQFGQYAGT